MQERERTVGRWAGAVAVVVLVAVAAAIWSGRGERAAARVEARGEEASGEPIASVPLARDGAAPRRAVAGEAPPLRPTVRAGLEARLTALARAETALARGQEPDAARARLEEVVVELCRTPDALASIGAVRARVAARDEGVAREEGAADEALRSLRYGAVRGFYWVVQDRERSGDGALVRAAVFEAVDHLAQLELGTATFLCDCLVALVEDRAIAPPDALLERLIERRLRTPERANLFDRVLMAVAQGLDEDARFALSKWLVSDPSDADAVAASLAGFFDAGRVALGMEVARDAFARGDHAARTLVAEAVARRAPADDAAAFLVERADGLQAAIGAWAELGARDGGTEALQVAYDGLRALEENATGRRLAVMAMGAAEPEDLRWIARDDPDPHVRGQAFLTLTTRGGPIDGADLDTAVELLDGLDAHAFGSAAAGARNLLRRAARGGRTDERVRLVEALRAAALDPSKTPRARREALRSLDGWIDDAERQWLEDDIAGE